MDLLQLLKKQWEAFRGGAAKTRHAGQTDDEPISGFKGNPMVHPVYRPWTRAKNQALIKALLEPEGRDSIAKACWAHQKDFSPSLYAELDWQRFRPDLEDPDRKQILDVIHGLFFVIGFPTNLEIRDQGRQTIRLDPVELSRLEPIIHAWEGAWFKPGGLSVLASFDQFVESLRTPPRRAIEVDLRESALKQLDQALGKIMSPSNLAQTAEQILVNAQYAFLDLPWTRQAVRASLVLPDSPASLLSVLPDEQDMQHDPRAIATHLRQRADIVNAPGAEEWATLLRGAADRIAAVDPARLTGDDGDWTEGRSVCGQCAMWFASRTAAAMDDQVTFERSSSRHIIYMPQGSMVCSCPFCGFAAPNSVPTLFFAEQRGQVIYLAPSPEGVSKTEAISFWTPQIQELQERYLERRGNALSEEFWAAAELVTHDLAEFFYAIQMGDTIAEDHVFNMIDLADGSALIFDGEKGFARVVTSGEAQVLRATHPVEGAPPEVAARLAKDGPSGSILRPEEVEELLGYFCNVNDAFDADLARSRQKPKADG